MPEDVSAARPQEPRTPPYGWAPNFAAVTDGNHDAVARWMKDIFALSHEMTRFTQARVQADLETWWKLASCRRVEDVVDCQQRFATTAAEHYAQEMTRLSQMLLNTATDGVSTLRALPVAGP